MYFLFPKTIFYPGPCWRQCGSPGRQIIRLWWLRQHVWAVRRGGSLRPDHPHVVSRWTTASADLLARQRQHFPTVHAAGVQRLRAHWHPRVKRHPPASAPAPPSAPQSQQQYQPEPEPGCEPSALSLDLWHCSPSFVPWVVLPHQYAEVRRRLSSFWSTWLPRCHTDTHSSLLNRLWPYICSRLEKITKPKG